MADGFTCEVESPWDLRPWDKDYRFACEGLGFYSAHKGKRYCVLHYPGEEKREDFEQIKESKLARKDYDFRGAFFPEGTSNFERYEFDANVEFAGAAFSGTADFSNAQFSGTRTDFSYARFSGESTSFSAAQFSGESTSFFEAQFSSSGTGTLFFGAEFSSEETNFSRARFGGKGISFMGAGFGSTWTDFSYAQFSSEGMDDFSHAQFRGTRIEFSAAQFSGLGISFRGADFSSTRTDFSAAQFSGTQTDFSYAQFGSSVTSFRETTFEKEVTFTEAIFRDNVAFRGSKGNPVFGPGAWAQFNRCLIEKPEQFTFNTVSLHPGWFCNTDVRKVDFTDVKWYGMPLGPEGALKEEIGALTKRDVESPHVLLSQACRRLSDNAEENGEYPLANEFHYWAMDAVRKGSWKHFKDLTLKGLLKKETWHDIGERFGPITTLYWLLNGYGVRAARAFWVLLGLWAMFTTLYVLVAPSEFKDFGQGIGYLWQAAVYSLLAMARLNPEPTPGEPGLFQFLVGLEGILGPLQIALLALAIRRKVMR